MQRADDVAGKVFVGNLPKGAREKEVEDAFTPFGELKSVWVARNPPGFGFVQFEDPRDAKDAVRMLDGTNVCGAKVKVELSNGRSKPKTWEPDSTHTSARKFDPDDKCFKCGNKGHYAYDCSSKTALEYLPRRAHSRSQSPLPRSNRRSRQRSFKRSRSRSLRRSRSRSGKRSLSPLYKTLKHLLDRSRSPLYTKTRSSHTSYRQSPKNQRQMERPTRRYEYEDRMGGNRGDDRMVGYRDRGYSRTERYEDKYRGRNDFNRY